MKKREMFFVCATLMAMMVSPVLADTDVIRLLVTEDHCEGNDGRLGGFNYNPLTNEYVTGLFGNGTGLRRYDATADTSQTYVTPTDLELFGRSSDPLGGVTDANDSGNMFIFAAMYNPKSLTVNGLTYQPGELAYVLNYTGAIKDDGVVSHMEWSKAIFRWDLRATGSVTSAQPDRDNAQNGVGVVTGSLGIADWNDNLTTVASNQQFIDAAQAVDPSASGTKRPYIGRNFSWNTDGQSFYVTSHGSSRYGTGGIYKVNAVTGAVSYIHPQAKVYGESAVLSSSVRNLGSGSGDQVLYGGTNYFDQWTEDNAINDGGISYIVDNGTTVSGENILLSGADIRAYLEQGDEDEDGNYGEETDVKTIATDAVGNVYFYEGKSSKAIHLLDTQGRLASVANNAEIEVFAASVDGSLKNSGGTYRLQAHQINGETVLMYRGDNAYIAGITIGRTGDFDSDGDIDADDTAFFIDQFNKSDGTLPAFTTDGVDNDQDYLDYIAADINGNSNADNDGVLAEASVTGKDFELLQQFISLEAGDINWDGLVDMNDYQLLQAGFGATADATWFSGDLTGDGAVDINDYQVFQSAFGNSYELDIDLLPTGPGVVVPEPASLLVLLTSATAVLARRRRK